MTGFAISYREIRTDKDPEPKTVVLEPTPARIASDVRFRGTIEVLRFLREAAGQVVEDNYVVFLKLPGRGNFFVPFYVTKGELVEYAKSLVAGLASGSSRQLEDSELRALHRFLMTKTYLVTVSGKKAIRTGTDVFQFNLEETDQPAAARVTKLELGQVLWMWNPWSQLVRVVAGTYAPVPRVPSPTRQTAPSAV